MRVVAAFPQRLCERREGLGRLLGERLPSLTRPQPLGVRERPLEPVACRGVGQIVQAELVRLADAVGPVGADPEPLHVGDDQQRRVLQRQRVRPELPECGVEVFPLPLVLPGEVVALPDVGPAVAAGVLASAPLEAVSLAARVGLGWRRLAEQPAQIDEVLLRGRAFLQLGGAPLVDELVRRHERIQSSRSNPGRLRRPGADEARGCPRLSTGGQVWTARFLDSRRGQPLISRSSAGQKWTHEDTSLFRFRPVRSASVQA